MQIIINNCGNCRCVYDEASPVSALGRIRIRRGSHVEPVAGGKWLADMSPVGGPVLGPFNFRSRALAAERRWLAKHWMSSS